MRPQVGIDLEQARKKAGLNQVALAARVGASLPTIRLAERGMGGLETFMGLAAAVGMEIGGRNLPTGGSIGERLAALAARQQVGRRPVAALAGCSPTTLARLEAGEDCHLSAVLAIAQALGVRLELAPVGASQRFFRGAGTSIQFQGWTTPRGLLEALYHVVGGDFGLDPCSPVRRGPNAPVRARVRLTADDDALSRPWRAETVYLNPPYGRELAAWGSKARAEAESGNAGIVIALVPARTDTRWWHDHIVNRADVWLLKGRLAFGAADNMAPFASSLVVWSATPEIVRRMGAAFPEAWHVPRPVHDPLQDLAAD